MTENGSLTGHCLCGDLMVRAYPMRQVIGVCHCRMCRKWCGGPYMGIECHDAVEVMGRSSVATFASSEWAYRAFCSQCGSHLFFRMNDGSMTVVAAGLFDLDETWQLTDEVFMEDKPPHYAFKETQRQWIGDGERLVDG